IKRTTEYVKLILQELLDRGHFRELLTKDYINNLQMAAPMHDIGKIAIPDTILQKPGKLTDEEYSIMKEHSQKGADIILQTFGKRNDKDFLQTAYEVAYYHHEKWNGKGYPKGLKETEIPLTARIMAIADVFDAISQKRCYRDAMPLDKCFEIIKNGRETDFDPLLVDIFVEIRPKVEKVYESIYS
ncbi:MAG: HD domain-containing protein, partial [Spirochaetaceae bacterium]|nr:HD domain-containing protein [Spirochaetaceae bacterium]